MRRSRSSNSGATAGGVGGRAAGTGGILLRHSSIPRPYLACVYAAIGAALLQASTNYYQRPRQIALARVATASD